MKYENIIAVDGGGSGCRVRLVDRQGQTRATATGGPANIQTDFESARRNITETVSRAYAEIGKGPEQAARDFALLGLAGAGQPEAAQRMETALDFALVRVVDDLETTVEGALGDRDGTVALTGTGSFFVCRNGGHIRKIGGWGYQLGDECSGAWLGRELYRATLHARDGLIDHSPLTLSVWERFDGQEGNIIRFASTATPGIIARIAPEIAESNRAGDPVAVRIMAESVSLFCTRLDALECDGDLYLLGGLAGTYLPLLPERFRNRHRPSQGNALDGAVSLAFKFLRHSR